MTRKSAGGTFASVHTRGLAVLPRRWTVERTLGWLMNHHRLARDCEAKPHSSEAMKFTSR